jgi:NADH-quinone oxidoreductase subunit G
VLDRPHLNDGARLVRVKPRVNPHVNRWWLCDEGRYGFGWLDRGRLRAPRGPDGEADWERALAALASALAGAPGGRRPRIGVLASAQLTNEELFLVRELFQRELGAQVSAAVPEEPGSCDEFLKKADKNPNTAGATLLGLAGPEALPAEGIVADALAGELDLLWVFGHDLVRLLGEERARRLAEAVPLLVFTGTSENASVPLARWVLPSAAYVEKDGTFVNCHGRLQRIGRAFPPLPEAREDWRILLDLAGRLGRPFAWRGPEEVFRALAGAPGPFAGHDYASIGAQGAALATTARATEAAAPCSSS